MRSSAGSYPRHRFPAEIISHAVWLHHLSFNTLCKKFAPIVKAERVRSARFSHGLQELCTKKIALIEKGFLVA